MYLPFNCATKRRKKKQSGINFVRCYTLRVTCAHACITICIRVVVYLLHDLSDVLRDGGMLSVFVTDAYAPLQRLRRLLDVLLRIAYDIFVTRKKSHVNSRSTKIKGIALAGKR